MRSLVLMILLSFFIINSSVAQKNSSKKIQDYWSLCGCANDGKILDTGGRCSACGMKLIEIGRFNYEMLSVSQNGTMVYTSNKQENKNHLYLKTLNSNVKEKLIGEGSGPQISPDEKKVLFSRNENTIFIYDIATGNIIDIGSKTSLPGLQTPAWFSANSIIFSAGKFPDLGIYKMNIDDRKTELLIKAEGLRYGCKVSPNEKNISCRCAKGKPGTDRQKGITVYDLTSNEEKFVTNIGEYSSWSPDGKSLAFHWPDSSDFCIYTVHADGTELKKIAGIKGSDCELPVWSTDGKKIFFQTNRRYGNWEIWTMNIDGTDQKPLLWK